MHEEKVVANDHNIQFLIRNALPAKFFSWVYYVFVMASFLVLMVNIFSHANAENYGLIVSFLCLGLVLGLTIFVIIHEGLQALIYYLFRARNISWQFEFLKLRFYVIADEFLISLRQFKKLSFYPFLIINGILLLLIFVSLEDIYRYTFFAALITHSLFCLKDFAILNFMIRNGYSYTFDKKDGNVTFFEK